MVLPETSEKQGDSPGYKRPGTLGVDYDPYGEEMAPNARIWRMYVEQTDKMDKEMVDGWNKTLDIILLFAALFSAISTAFVLESSKDLRPDPAVTSAQTLSMISNTLLAMANSSTISGSITMDSDGSKFTPETSAVVVNALWFMSLSLSVAVSLIAILAKEWCDGFITGRIGSMLKQGRIRQQRWDGIERWKMKEILYMLPLLMHAALLLFAIGLSLYLWNINVQVALPVVVTSAMAALFYIISVLMPLFSRFCPYTTTLAKLTCECLIFALRNPGVRKVVMNVGALMQWTWQRIRYINWRLLAQMAHLKPKTSDIENGGHDAGASARCDPFSTCRWDHSTKADDWVKQIQDRFLTDRSQLLESETPMDTITSSMLAWMISYCEDPSAVDAVSQAVSGAELRLLPREPLWECGIIELVRERLAFCLETLQSTSRGFEHDRLLENACLYSRTLTFLTTCIPQELIASNTYGLVDRGVFYVSSWSDGPDGMLNLDMADGFNCVVRPFCILNRSMELLSPCHDIAAFELNNFPLGLYDESWDSLNRRRNQYCKQWEFLKGVVTGSVKLSSSAMLALVNGITKTYLYNPAQSPFLLVDLLNTSKPAGDSRWGQAPQEHQFALKLRYAIGTALAIFLVVSKRGSLEAHGAHTLPDDNLAQAEVLYRGLIMETPENATTESLLLFGLVGLLGKPRDEYDIIPDTKERNSINRALSTLGFFRHDTYASMPASFLKLNPGAVLHSGAHWASLTLEWLDSTISEYGRTSNIGTRENSYLDMFLCKELCLILGTHLVPGLMKRFTESTPPETKRLCLKALRYALPPGDSYRFGYISYVLSAFQKQILESQFLARLLQFMDLEYASRQDILDGIYFQWIAATCTLLIKGNKQDLLNQLSIVFKSTVSLGDDEIPRNEHGLGLADLWRSKIEQICSDDPESMLTNGLIDEMIMFYKFYSDAKPRPAQLSDEEKTWLTILQGLKEDCKRRVASQTNAGDNQLPTEELENGELELPGNVEK